MKYYQLGFSFFVLSIFSLTTLYGQNNNVFLLSSTPNTLINNNLRQLKVLSVGYFFKSTFDADDVIESENTNVDDSIGDSLLAKALVFILLIFSIFGFLKIRKMRLMLQEEEKQKDLNK